ncbi:MAG: hypothetical protein M0004_07845 [Actinomycetota bacterium]|nr:hypothetical protein [Actinomycetota bacterium]
MQLLVINDDPDDERQAWWSRSPFACALAGAPLHELGVAPERARLVDVAIAAAFASGADVRVVPAAPALTDGLGGLLRFPDAGPAR